MSSNIKFVVNTIAGVSNIDEDDFENDSEDEEMDNIFEKFQNDPPEIEDKFPYEIKEVVVKENTFEVYTKKLKSKAFNSSVVGPLLGKLSKQAFYNKNKVKGNISACFYLNKMLSVSQRRNYSLFLEASNNFKSNIDYKKFAYFWCCSWRNKEKKLSYEDVQKYYKQLKRHNKDKAKKFLEETEDKVKYVPYQRLREDLKKHIYTKDLVAKFKNNNEKNKVYLCLIDADTINFNHIFEDYVNKITEYEKQGKKIPRIISTGYVFPKEQDYPLYLASEFDRQIRIIIAKEFSLGIYFPEPNMCILIPDGSNTVPESFVDNKKDKLESAILIRNIISGNEHTDGNTFVFFDGNPLITKIPQRTNSIIFSDEFKFGAPPSTGDFNNFQKITQSSYKAYNWLNNLFINNGIKLINNLDYHVKDTRIRLYCKILLAIYNKIKSSEQEKLQIKEQMRNYINEEIIEAVTKKWAQQYCKKIITKLRNSSDTHERQKFREELELYITPEITGKIIKFIASMDEYIQNKENELIRNEDDDKLLDFLSERDILPVFIETVENQGCKFKDATVVMKIIEESNNVDTNNFNTDSLLLFLKPEIFELIQDELLDPGEFITIDYDTLEFILDQSDIIDALANSTCDQNDLLEILIKDEEIKECFIRIIQNGEYSVEYIIEKYKEHKLHLKLLGNEDDNMTAYVYENSMDWDIVTFAFENYKDEIDWDSIIKELGPSDAENFKVWIGFYNDEEYEYSQYSPHSFPNSEESQDNYSLPWDSWDRQFPY